ncbi:MAG: ArsR family transcriptional regulator [Candidatus Odinarchaeia archaeon]
MDEVNICKALSCESRWKILKILAISNLSIEEISKEIKLSPMTVRHHLVELEKAGLIQRNETTSKLMGRPKSIYSLNQNEFVISFPKRNYKLLHQILIRSLSNYFVNKSELYDFLILTSKEFTKEFLNQFQEEGKIVIWDLKNVKEKLILNGLSEYGGLPEIVEEGDNYLKYRLYQCPFSITENPLIKTICDAFQHTFLSEVEKLVGGIKINVLKTIPDGSPFCEFEIVKKR